MSGYELLPGKLSPPACFPEIWGLAALRGVVGTLGALGRRKGRYTELMSLGAKRRKPGRKRRQVLQEPWQSAPKGLSGVQGRL